MYSLPLHAFSLNHLFLFFQVSKWFFNIFSFFLNFTLFYFTILYWFCHTSAKLNTSAGCLPLSVFLANPWLLSIHFSLAFALFVPSNCFWWGFQYLPVAKSRGHTVDPVFLALSNFSCWIPGPTMWDSVFSYWFFFLQQQLLSIHEIPRLLLCELMWRFLRSQSSLTTFFQVPLSCHQLISIIVAFPTRQESPPLHLGHPAISKLFL